MLTKAEYSPIIKEVWAEEFYEELRPQLGVASLIQDEYEGEIKAWGDTVHVSQLQTPGRAQIRRNDNEAYNTQQPIFVNKDLIVDRSAFYGVDVTNWAEYQGNPKAQEKIRKLLGHEIARAVDEEIIDAINPAASKSGQSAMSKALIAEASRVLDVNNVPDDGSRIAIIDPYYKEDLIQINEFISRDFNPTSSVFLSGSIKDPVYGFKVYVSNLLPQNTAYFWHPSFMQIAMQRGAEYKEMDLEASTNVPSKRVRAENLFGLEQFDNKRVYKIYNT